MPPAARVSDQTAHGTPLAPGPGSADVLIGFLPAWRAMIDQHACPAVNVSGADGVGSVLMGSPTVMINNQMACRQMDIVVEKPGLAMGPMNPIVLGCMTVIIGEVGMGVPSAPSISMPSVNVPTADEQALAAQPGSSPEQISAREKVVQNFYEGKPGLGADRASQDLKGIDLTKPVEVVDIPPPPTMAQYVRKATGKPGNFFDPLGNQTGSQLGLNDDPVIRVAKTFKTPKGQALKSTAAPIVDDWTNKAKPVKTAGGGTQMVVDSATRDRFEAI
ncbi:MAG TPA: polymorphic toxin type 46 domain-containing protein [Terriglobales bacterium]|nr:polymorphic toxin type 46 domain-containing protein [Terriglobales bacterium]